MQCVRRVLITVLLVLCTFSIGATGPATSRAAGQLSRIEVLQLLTSLELQAQVFSCEAMVVAVNGLRQLGKDEALKLLRQFYSVAGMREPREMTIICVCRVLFVSPKDGWDVPWGDFRYMTDPPGYGLAEKRRFPLYPMALSDGVPFLLNTGWKRPNGRINVPIPDEGKKHLDLCDTLELIPADLQAFGYEEAARRLVASDEFNRLPAGTLLREWIPEQATRRFRKGDFRGSE